MLKQRLIFGTLLTVGFVLLVLAGGWFDGSLTEASVDKPLQGTVFFVLAILLLIPAHLELSNLFNSKGFNSQPIASGVISIFMLIFVYTKQIYPAAGLVGLCITPAVGLFVLMYYHYLRLGLGGLVVNCGLGCFSVFYLGILTCFALSVRIDFGVWGFLMYVFVIKCSDIGAYTAGKLFGKHKFSPVISPKKTWEGMAGAVVFAVVTGFLFAYFCNIMLVWYGMLFGIIFAFTGQLGDLAESMIKRDFERKDSSGSLPGFGGLLDLLDSPLAGAPFAYLYFYLVC